MTTVKVPFLDLSAPHHELRDDLLAVFRSALDTSQFIGGTDVQRFEEEFAAFSRSSFCVGVGSGTDALRFALTACGVRPGDTVVTVPFTFIATAEAISQAGAHVDFVDIDPRTYTMDPDRLRAYVDSRCVPDRESGGLRSKRTGGRVSAIVPVHLYGQVADMDPILALAEHHGLSVIEDACQAHGAEYYSRKDSRWRTAGSIGHAAAFSFYPSKNLGACGEAGAVTTGDPEIARQCRLLRDHGQSAKYVHDIEGYNGRLDAIQAGVLRAKLRHLGRWNELRRENARRYDKFLAPLDGELALPWEAEWSRAVYHVYVVRARDRERLRAGLEDDGIGTGVHYPVPLHLLTAYGSLGFRAGDFPVAERAASEVLSLPMFPELSEQQQTIVAEALHSRIRGR